MPRRKRNPYVPPPPDQEIKIERDGKTYEGYYSVYRNTLKVSLIGGGSKTAAVSMSGRNDVLARVILGELIAEQESQ